METWKECYHILNSIIQQNNLIEEKWYKINKISLMKQSNKNLNNKDIKLIIINDFTTLYGLLENKKFDINKI